MAGCFTATSVAAWVTDNDNLKITSMAATLSGGAVAATLPAYSLVTFVLTGNVTTGCTTSTSTSTSASSTTTSKEFSTTSSSTGTTTGCASAEWGQCAGIGWTGCTSVRRVLHARIRIPITRSVCR